VTVTYPTLTSYFAASILGSPLNFKYASTLFPLVTVFGPEYAVLYVPFAFPSNNSPATAVYSEFFVYANPTCTLCVLLFLLVTVIF